MRLLAAVLLSVLLCVSALAQNYNICPFAGGGLPENNASATSVWLSKVAGDAVDTAGNMYFVALGTVFQLHATTGKLTRIAGNGSYGYSGDGGPAAIAKLASFMLAGKYAVTANKRGTVEFTTARAGQIAALGIRATPGGTFTTIPALAN